MSSVTRWPASAVSTWVERCLQLPYGAKFSDAGIDGKRLVQLREDEISALGIHDSSHVQQILSHIDAFRSHLGITTMPPSALATSLSQKNQHLSRDRLFSPRNASSLHSTRQRTNACKDGEGPSNVASTPTLLASRNLRKECSRSKIGKQGNVGDAKQIGPRSRSYRDVGVRAWAAAVISDRGTDEWDVSLVSSTAPTSARRPHSASRVQDFTNNSSGANASTGAEVYTRANEPIPSDGATPRTNTPRATTPRAMAALAEDRLAKLSQPQCSALSSLLDSGKSSLKTSAASARGDLSGTLAKTVASYSTDMLISPIASMAAGSFTPPSAHSRNSMAAGSFTPPSVHSRNSSEPSGPADSEFGRTGGAALFGSTPNSTHRCSASSSLSCLGGRSSSSLGKTPRPASPGPGSYTPRRSQEWTSGIIFQRAKTRRQELDPAFFFADERTLEPGDYSTANSNPSTCLLSSRGEGGPRFGTASRFRYSKYERESANSPGPASYTPRHHYSSRFK